MISGIIKPPYFNVVNHKIIERHLMAACLGSFFRKYPDYFKSLESFVLEGGAEEFKKYIDEGNKLKGKVKIKGLDSEAEYYSPEIGASDYYSRVIPFEEEKNAIGITVDWKCVNGYLSISLYYKYRYGDLSLIHI